MMANEAFCEAVREVAGRIFPEGFDVSPHAPNTFLDLALYMAKTGRICVRDHGTSSNDFDTIETWHAFRAWHDWCHLQGGHPFTLHGECATVRMQLATIGAMFGLDKLREWQPILIQQIINDNFGDDTACLDALDEP